MPEFTSRAVLPLIRQALAEDRARRDVTSAAAIPPSTRIRARIIAKTPGIAAGVEIAQLVFTTLDPSLRCRLHVRSGARLRRGQTLLTVQGRARAIFAAERTALNFLGHLSGIATLTRAFVDKTRGTRVKIFDTRKTLPGLRALEKHAVCAGGGHSHRSDLAEAILIKTNHLRALSTQHSALSKVIRHAIELARRIRPRRFIELEVTNLREFQAALRAQPDAILLDNWGLADIRRAVAHSTQHTAHRRPILEVSGGVTLGNVRAIAKTGVDRISVGRLTHSAPSLDVSLQVV